MPVNFHDLPIETVLHIFSFIGPDDIRNLRQTCKRIHQITQLSSVKKKVELVFENRYISDDSLPGSIFTGTTFEYDNVSFKNSDLRNAVKLLRNLGRSIKSATFSDIIFKKGELSETLGYMYKLQKIKLKDVCSPNFQIEGVPNIIYIRSLSLSNVSIELYMSFLHCKFAHLVELRLGFVTRESLQEIIRLIRVNSKTLIDLGICICGKLDIAGQAQLINVINLLKLKKLKLSGNIFPETILDILKCQPFLQHLDISGTQPDSRAIIMNIIGEKLNDICVLKLKDCNKLSNENIRHISKLEKLRVLHITQCNRNYDDEKLELEGFGIGTLMHLEEICIKNFNLHTNTFNHCTKIFSNLKILDLGENFLDCSYTLLQAICENLLLLEDLNINSVIKNKHEIPVGIQNLKKLKRLSLFNCKISNVSLYNSLVLPNLKKFQIGYNSLITDKGIKELVSNCRSIETLELVACRNLTNISINYILTELKELKYLNLNFCKGILRECLNRIIEHKSKLKTLSLIQNNGQKKFFVDNLLILTD